MIVLNILIFLVNNQWDSNKTFSANQAEHHQPAKGKEAKCRFHNEDVQV